MIHVPRHGRHGGSAGRDDTIRHTVTGAGEPCNAGLWFSQTTRNEWNGTGHAPVCRCCPTQWSLSAGTRTNGVQFFFSLPSGYHNRRNIFSYPTRLLLDRVSIHSSQRRAALKNDDPTGIRNVKGRRKKERQCQVICDTFCLPGRHILPAGSRLDAYVCH